MMVLRFGKPAGIHEGYSKVNLALLNAKMGLKSKGNYTKPFQLDRNEKLTGHEESAAQSRWVAATEAPLTIQWRIEKTGAVYL